jgi:hypothetical protein
VFHDTCINISLEEKRGIDTKRELADNWRILERIMRFLGHDYIFIAHRKTLRDGVVEDEAQAREADVHSSFVVNEAYAFSLFKCISDLTYIPKDVFRENHYRFDVLHSIMFEHDLRNGYQTPFTEKLWKRIFYNVKEKHYPAVLWVYLDMMGFFLSGEAKGGDGWVVEEVKKLRRLLYLDLKPMIEAGELMINDKPVKDVLLPISITYENGDFVYHSGNKLSKSVVIARPPDGEKSMLEGFEPSQDDRAYWWS